MGKTSSEPTGPNGHGEELQSRPGSCPDVRFNVPLHLTKDAAVSRGIDLLLCYHLNHWSPMETVSGLVWGKDGHDKGQSSDSLFDSDE